MATSTAKQTKAGKNGPKRAGNPSIVNQPEPNSKNPINGRPGSSNEVTTPGSEAASGPIATIGPEGAVAVVAGAGVAAVDAFILICYEYEQGSMIVQNSLLMEKTSSE